MINRYRYKVRLETISLEFNVSNKANKIVKLLSSRFQHMQDSIIKQCHNDENLVRYTFRFFGFSVFSNRRENRSVLYFAVSICNFINLNIIMKQNIKYGAPNNI